MDTEIFDQRVLQLANSIFSEFSKADLDSIVNVDGHELPDKFEFVDLGFMKNKEQYFTVTGLPPLTERDYKVTGYCKLKNFYLFSKFVREGISTKSITDIGNGGDEREISAFAVVSIDSSRVLIETIQKNLCDSRAYYGISDAEREKREHYISILEKHNLFGIPLNGHVDNLDMRVPQFTLTDAVYMMEKAKVEKNEDAEFYHNAICNAIQKPGMPDLTKKVDGMSLFKILRKYARIQLKDSDIKGKKFYPNYVDVFDFKDRFLLFLVPVFKIAEELDLPVFCVSEYEAYKRCNVTTEKEMYTKNSKGEVPGRKFKNIYGKIGEVFGGEKTMIRFPGETREIEVYVLG